MDPNHNIGDAMTFKKTVIARSVAGLAKEESRRSRNVAFGKDTDANIAKMDGGSTEDQKTSPKKKADRDDDEDTSDEGIARRTRSRTDDSAVATRTKSKDVVVTMAAKDFIN